MQGVPMEEFARPIYEEWDRVGFPPPKGYNSWMEYLESGFQIKRS